MMNEKMRKPENKGKERQKPLSQFLKKMETRSEGISVLQKLAEANALVKTEDRVTDEDVSNLLEKEDAKGIFKIIRDDKYGNPKVVATTYTEKGDKVDLILEISNSKHEKNVSEILEGLGGAVSEDLLKKVKLIEQAYSASIVTNDPRLVEEIIMLVTRSKLNFERSESMSHELRMAESVFYVPARERVYNAVMRNPNYLSDDADWIKDDVY